MLSQTPDVVSFLRKEVMDLCGALPIKDESQTPCVLIIASDGLW